MKNSGFSLILHRLSLFFFHGGMWLISIVAIAGFLLAVQSKRPFDLTINHPQMVEEESGPQYRELIIIPPISHYAGPVIFQVHYRTVDKDVPFTLVSGEELLSESALPDGKEGIKAFYLFPGDLNTQSGITLRLETRETSGAPMPITRVSFDFPKAGTWLIPDIWLWTSLFGITLLFGMICALIWDAPINVLSSYAGTLIMLMLAIHFGGLELAWRIGDKFFAVLLLFITVLIIRGFVIPAKPVVFRQSNAPRGKGAVRKD